MNHQRNATIRTSALGILADALGRGGRYLRPGDGRSVYAGVEWRMP